MVLERDNLTIRVNGVLRDRLEVMRRRPFVNSRDELGNLSKSFGPLTGMNVRNLAHLSKVYCRQILMKAGDP